uniref:Protein FAM151A n=1 Tax=Periophthalmus magnuspinnatus TaxID=409849 RepID=A0A3B4ANX5_9GOBI
MNRPEKACVSETDTNWTQLHQFCLDEWDKTPDNYCENVPDLSFSTGGDMLDFLVQSGDISKRDALLATWFHRANGKEEMNRALASDAMILEADVTLHGFGTANQKPVPIMAHPPNVTSDNTLDQWLDAVLESRKGIKLDFKSLASVGLSLSLLSQKNSTRGIRRPVWLNADVLKDPLVPGFIPTVNGTQFLELVQEKFPDVTLSLGWMVRDTQRHTDTHRETETHRDTQRDTQRQTETPDTETCVTFPIQSLYVRRGWPHISWLLSQSSRFSLTLWQGSTSPTVDDLLFVRDNSHPARVYYDIYEPTLTHFKQAVGKSWTHTDPHGPTLTHTDPHLHNMSVLHMNTSNADFLISKATFFVTFFKNSEYLKLVQTHLWLSPVPVTRSCLSVHLNTTLTCGSHDDSSRVLQDVLDVLSLQPGALWGLYLRLGAPGLLGASLSSLLQFYSSERLYRPVWIGMDPNDSCSTQVRPIGGAWSLLLLRKSPHI